MLERPGDLIPVLPNAVTIPWTRRRSQILNYLHRGPVTFNTLVYDTNVGDISSLATYFNPDRISERELNLRFGHYPTTGEKHESPPKRTGADVAVRPRLLLYPDHSQEKVARTYNWVMSQDSKAGSPLPVSDGSQAAAGHHQSGQTVRQPQQAQRRLEREQDNSTLSTPACLDVSLPTLSVNCNFSNPLLGKHFTLPTSAISSVLDNVWSDKGADSPDSSWPEKLSESGLGLGELASRVNKSSAEVSWETGGVQSFC